MMQDVAILALAGLPLLAFVPYFTPPEWWLNLHDDSSIARSANWVLWHEVRLGEW